MVNERLGGGGKKKKKQVHAVECARKIKKIREKAGRRVRENERDRRTEKKRNRDS